MKARAGVRITVRDRRSRFAAVDRSQGWKVIAEGRTASDTSAKARDSGKRFALVFVPPTGQTCIY